VTNSGGSSSTILIGALAGGIGVLFVAVVVVIALVLFRRKKSRRVLLHDIRVEKTTEYELVESRTQSRTQISPLVEKPITKGTASPFSF
jgi:hypothetical protein